MVFASNQLKLSNGMIVAVPNPHPADSMLIQNAIDQALEEAKIKNIIGNQITPFLLSRIEELTQGRSLDSNISLVLNNAKVAAEIAVAYEQLVTDFMKTSLKKHNSNNNSHDGINKTSAVNSSSSEQHQQQQRLQPSLSKTTTNIAHDSNTSSSIKKSVPLLIFGGCVTDIIATSTSSIIPGSSNPGHVQFTHGGVARNIAARLSSDYNLTGQLATAVASDENGKGLLKHLVELGIDISKSIVVSHCNNKTSQTANTNNTNISANTNATSNNTTTNNNTISMPSLNNNDILRNTHHIEMSSDTPITTSNYLAIHNNNGELVVGIADMKILQYITANYIQSLAGSIRNTSLVVIDANLSPESFQTVINLASTYNVPVFYEPTSDAKCCLAIQTGMLHKVSNR